MKDVFLIYNGCCFYEIVILSYFLNYSHCEICFCSPDGAAVQAMEGFTVNAGISLADLDVKAVRSFIVPGGRIPAIDTQAVHAVLQELRRRDALLAGICAGVDVLDHAGVLRGVRSTHSEVEDCVADGNVITARANAYVDFAVETAKKLGLFKSETELVTTGLYRFSRNPAFVGFDLMYAGVLLLYANVLTLLFSAFAIVMLHLQILQEERYLTAEFGAPYTAYCRRVFRYFGRRKEHT